MESETTSRPWYKKKRYIIPAALLGLPFAFSGGLSGSTSSTAIVPAAPVVEEVAPLSPEIETTASAETAAVDVADTQPAATVKSTSENSDTKLSNDQDTKSVVSGKSVSVRLVLGGRGSYKKKHEKT